MNKYKNKITNQYKSKLEQTAADLLRQNNIDFEYEPWEVLLLDKFQYPILCYERVGKVFKQQSIHIRKMTYTPDFVGKRWIIETKGKKTPEFMQKWKLFKKHLLNNKLKFVLFMPTNKREILTSIQVIKNLDDVL